MEEKAGRNDPCPCGSGLKYKKCCFGKPPKLKFTAKVIKSKPAESNLGHMVNNLHNTQVPDSKGFNMTDKDFRIDKK